MCFHLKREACAMRPGAAWLVASASEWRGSTLGQPPLNSLILIFSTSTHCRGLCQWSLGLTQIDAECCNPTPFPTASLKGGRWPTLAMPSMLRAHARHSIRSWQLRCSVLQCFGHLLHGRKRGQILSQAFSTQPMALNGPKALQLAVI